jgi:hypothetical protein
VRKRKLDEKKMISRGNYDDFTMTDIFWPKMLCKDTLAMGIGADAGVI